METPMVITYHGAAFCKVSQGDTTIALSPLGKEGDIVFVGREPFVISGAGEYEVGGIVIRGFVSNGIEGLINTVYTIVWDDITVCHTGALTDTALSPAVLEDIGDVDVLLIPVGYEGAPTPRDLVRLTKHIEPKVTIPLLGSGKNAEGEYAAFLKEVGTHSAPIDRYTFKKRDLEGKNGDVIILASV